MKVTKRVIETKLKQVNNGRVLLAQAIAHNETLRSQELSVMLIDLNSELVDLLQRAVSNDNPAFDQALVFCEFSPEGTIVPLDWIPTLRRNSKEPLTYIRVADSMIKEVYEVLK